MIRTNIIHNLNPESVEEHISPPLFIPKFEIAASFEANYREVFSGGGQWEAGTQGGGGRLWLEWKLSL